MDHEEEHCVLNSRSKTFEDGAREGGSDGGAQSLSDLRSIADRGVRGLQERGTEISTGIFLSAEAGRCFELS